MNVYLYGTNEVVYSQCEVKDFFTWAVVNVRYEQSNSSYLIINSCTASSYNYQKEY